MGSDEVGTPTKGTHGMGPSPVVSMDKGEGPTFQMVDYPSEPGSPHAEQGPEPRVSLSTIMAVFVSTLNPKLPLHARI